MIPANTKSRLRQQIRHSQMAQTVRVNVGRRTEGILANPSQTSHPAA
jgi:hypothetical protein